MPFARPTLSGYLIDPAAATIRAVELDPTHFHRTIRRLIGCDHMERVHLDEAHVAYCDSRRTTEPVTGFWTFPAHRSRPPIAGRAVIVGNDGASIPALPLRIFAATITAYRPVIIPDAVALARLAELHVTEQYGAFRRQVRIDGFQLEIERHRPLTIDDDDRKLDGPF
jgi:hypothetical protein